MIDVYVYDSQTKNPNGRNRTKQRTDNDEQLKKKIMSKNYLPSYPQNNKSGSVSYPLLLVK